MGYPPNPVQAAKDAKLHAQVQLARELEQGKRWIEAEAAYRQALVIREQEGLPFESRASFGLARVLKAQNRRVEAFEACKGAIAWSSKAELWRAQGEFLNTVTSELSILAAENGYKDLAIEMYYAGLSAELRRGADQRIPLMVVFQPSPGMTEWTYSVDRLTAASLALRVAGIISDPTEMDAALDRIIAIAPEWYWPHAYRTFELDSPSYALAESRCRNDQERDWLHRRINQDETIYDEADEIRKNCEFIHVRNRNLLPGAEVVDW